MYSIANVIYGIPLFPARGYRHKRSDLIEEALECEEPGFLTYYSGDGDVAPGAFGVELDTFDPGSHHTELSSLTLAPTPDQITEFNDLMAGLELELADAVKKYGEPRVFFLWSTS